MKKTRGSVIDNEFYLCYNTVNHRDNVVYNNYFLGEIEK